MTLQELDAAEVTRRLRGDGLILRVGPFTYRLFVGDLGIDDAIRRLYADYPVENHLDFVDFRFRIEPASGAVRRFRFRFRPRAAVTIPGDVEEMIVPRSDALPYLEWGLNWCVWRQSGRDLMLHAAVLERDGRGLLLLGDSGAGKSTLCAGLVLDGWRLLSDEIALLAGSPPRLLPLARPIGLKNRSIETIERYAVGKSFPAVFGPRCPGTVKGELAHLKPPADSIRRADEPAIPAWMAFVEYRPDAAGDPAPVPKPAAALQAVGHAFNYSARGELGFRTLVDLADGSDCFRYKYSDLDSAVTFFRALAPPGPTSPPMRMR